MIDLNPILSAVRLSAAATRRIRDIGMGARDKGVHDPVTLADYASQVILCRAVAQAYPDDALMGEERAAVFDSTLDAAGQESVARVVSETLGETLTVDQCRAWLEHGRDRDPARLWLIDPIDGTKGYIAGRRYAIAVALLVGGLPVAGVIGAPDPTDRDGGLICYGQGTAAYVQPMRGERAERIAVTAQSDPHKWRAVESFDRSHGNFNRSARVYNALGIAPARVGQYDSQIKYAMLAAGDAELFLRFPRDDQWVHLAWDHAPGTALLQAAGGVITDLDGALIDFSTGARLTARGMVATNGMIHDRVLEAVQEALNAAEDQ
ncbi:MAG: hypothetical protein L6Q98_05165 [Anaerolineae bacterium]|nr:hypothetical protein [Anaerolineae bacterium]NUQ05627.1 hypothetical protein [Anaerolineae bacterium]